MLSARLKNNIIDLNLNLTMETVRFNIGLPYNGRVFYQPLFYLAENYKQALKVANGCKEVEKKRIDSDLDLMENIAKGIKLSSSTFISDRDDSKLFYSVQIEDNAFTFKYKDAVFNFAGVDSSKLPKKLVEEKRDDAVLYSSYEISFESKYMNTFEALIKKCIVYWEQYYNNDKEDYNKISIYLTANEGFFFNYLGKRHKREMDSIYLPKKQKNDIIADLEKFLRPETRDRYLKLGINHKRVYLLEGIPGSGKTSLITAMASKFNYNIAIVSFTMKMTDMDLLRLIRSISDTHEDINCCASDSKKKSSILVFEDIDCIFKERKAHDENKNGITFSGLLNALDGITSNENLVCFITTNYKSHLDSALLRPGRVDYIMRFDYSNKEQIQDMYRDFSGCDTTVDGDKIKEFYTACSELKIKISTSLLQQYLMKYLDKPDEAIANVEEMKTMFEKTKIDREAEDTNLYS